MIIRIVNSIIKDLSKLEMEVVIEKYSRSINNMHEETSLTLLVNKTKVFVETITYSLHEEFTKDNLDKSIIQTLYMRLLANIASVGIQTGYITKKNK